MQNRNASGTGVFILPTLWPYENMNWLWECTIALSLYVHDIPENTSSSISSPSRTTSALTFHSYLQDYKLWCTHSLIAFRLQCYINILWSHSSILSFHFITFRFPPTCFPLSVPVQRKQRPIVFDKLVSLPNIPSSPVALYVFSFHVWKGLLNRGSINYTCVFHFQFLPSREFRVIPST